MILIPIIRRITFIEENVMNAIIVSAILSWMVAQASKVLYGLMKYGHDDRSRVLWRLVWAGGMPSAHSALVTSTTLTVLLSAGIRSALFGLSLVVSGIVIYDRSRMHSIYKTFQEKYPVLKDAVQGDPVLKDLVGHSFPEILVGILIGFVTGAIAFVCFR